MVSTNKLRKTTSILIFSWMILFICLSTSHMGNTHCLYFPKNISKTQLIQQHLKGSEDQCPWTYAALMTLGDVLVPDNTPTVDFDELTIAYLQQSILSKIYFDTNPRGPPAI